MPPRADLSRFLSLVLRHHPEAADVSLDPGGWIQVADLLAGCARVGRPIDPKLLNEVVATNDKQRFELSEDKSRIRACQGHSIPVELGHEPLEPPATLYHGTARRFLDAIWREGLKPRTRQLVHLSTTPEVARTVGQRHGEPVVLHVAAGRMHHDGHVFFRATNGVWLTEVVPAASLSLG